MKSKVLVKLALVSGAAMLVIACSAPQAPDFEGRWKPLNQFEKKIRVIPKTRPYAYEVIQLDTTLASVLERWALDSKVKFKSSCDSDYSLPTSITQLKAPTLEQGIKQVNDIYLQQGVQVGFNSAEGVLNFDCKPFELSFPQP